MDSSIVRVLVVEDYRPYQTFVTSLLESKPELQVVCEVTDGLEAVEMAQQLRPDVIVMDIGLPELNGIEAARRIRKLLPEAKIVFLTQERSAEVVQEALDLGAWGYIFKQKSGTDLLAGVAAILHGKRFVSSAQGDGFRTT